MKTWITTHPREETNVDVWVKLGGGRFTVWGAVVFEHGDTFEEDLRNHDNGWVEL